MLSICIPVYNFDLRSLVKSLHEQALLLDVPVEIVVIDDASAGDYQKLNKDISDFDLVRYEILPENAGRSRIRNLLAHKAHYNWLIIMDCDSATPDELYLKRYLEQTNGNTVVCGGRTYLEQPPKDNTYLHWLYGTKREVRDLAQRSKNPHLSFMTNNFMVPKSIIKQMPFNENIKGYGHEDTLFGYELMKNGVPVKHIDNPLLHVGLQTNREFIEKSREGIKNLAFINNYLDDEADLGKMVRLLAWFKKLKRFKLCNTFAFVFSILRSPVEKNLLGRTPSLLLFDFYKLGFFCENRHQA
jgi:glycosyltransferase involved in cell wall biosynthesis